MKYRLARVDAAALETAAQQYTDLLCERFPADVLLARLFVTVPYGNAPADVRAFVDQLAKKTGISDRIRDDTLILSLAGTSGKEPDWNDRRRSRGHAGIPLATADFIDAVPMMSRLLRELGLGLDWIDARDTTIIARSLGSSSGVFYVREAVNETDTQGRKVIAAQDFVREHGVQTVFGMGGAYIGTASFLVNIVFCKTLVGGPEWKP